MITIVIADDEKIIRAGIKKILTDYFGTMITVTEARNGDEAYNLCLGETPDIVITDIRMPGMDGVELMKKIRELEQRPEIIVLSGYDDFTYAKAAIQSGALSYILKPVDTKELESAVSAAISSVRRDEKLRSEQKLRTIMTEERPDGDTELAGKFPNGMYCITASGRNAALAFTQTLGQIQYYTIDQKKDFISIVIPREALYLIESDIGLGQYRTGISSAGDSVLELRTLRRESLAALLEYFYAADGKQAINRYLKENSVADFSAVDGQWEKLISRLDMMSADEVQRAVNGLFEFPSGSPQQQAECLQYVYDKVSGSLFKRYPKFSGSDMYLHLKEIMIENIWQVESLAEWKGYVCDYAVYLAALLKQHAEPYPFITRAVEYISAHYTENINMAVVANRVSVNYTWFSEKFKEQTGANFNDYLKRLRLEEAKRLLEKGCYKVYEVSAKAGFGDVKYFMKTFHEATGMSPGEWKERHSKE